ncbi:MAG: MFS transporter [Deltaproteobacteria bacterium]|nr:MFS transporter [Deltaproteobacteria bacterium]
MDTPTAPVDTTTTKRVAGVVRSFGFYRNSTFLTLLIGYAGYYLCRQNFSAAYPAMKDALHMDKATFGAITSFGTLMYALGKFTTGALADTRGGRTIFLVGLIGVVVGSLVIGTGISTGIPFFFAAWGIVRLFQSMGWAGVVNVMARWFPKSQYGTAMGLMSVNYQFGGVVATMFAGYLLELKFGWQALFFLPALVLAGIGVVAYFTLTNCPQDVGHVLPSDSSTDVSAGSRHAADTTLSYLSRFRIVLGDRMFLLMCTMSFILTLLRECFNVWMPAYFSDMGAAPAMAAFKSAVFPLMGCIGTIFTGWYSDKYLQGRRGPIMATLMGVLVILLMALGHLELVAQVTGLERSTAAVWLVAATGFFLLGPYSLVGGVVALDFGGRRTAGTAAGLLDGIGYLGATLAGWGVAEVVVKLGWSQAFTFMAGLTVLAIILCGFLWRVRPRE